MISLGTLQSTLTLTFDLDVNELRVYTQCEVTRQSPWCGGPCNQTHTLILQQREVHNDGWILNVLL